MWNFFCGAKYPKFPVNIAPKFKKKYATFMNRNQAKSTMSVSLSNELIMRQNMLISVNSSKIRGKVKGKVVPVLNNLSNTS
jgi:hypothetical protein